MHTLKLIELSLDGSTEESRGELGEGCLMMNKWEGPRPAWRPQRPRGECPPASTGGRHPQVTRAVGRAQGGGSGFGGSSGGLRRVSWKRWCISWNRKTVELNVCFSSPLCALGAAWPQCDLSWSRGGAQCCLRVRADAPDR